MIKLRVRITVKIIAFLFSMWFYCTATAQDVDFEINVSDDSLNISSGRLFLTEGGYLWKIQKAPLYGELKYYTDYLYSIDEQGDTNTALCFSRPDTVFNYFDMIKTTLGEPGYLLSGLLESLEEPDITYTIFTRLDDSLNIIWEKMYLFNYVYSGWHMRTIQQTDSSFVFCCSPRGSAYMYLLKLADNGDSLAYKAYSGDSAGDIWSLTYNPDSTALWLHNNWAHYSGNGFAVNSCIEIDENFNQVDVYHYPEYYLNVQFTSKLLPDGSLMSAGTSWVEFPEENRLEKYISIFKLDSNFNVIKEYYLTNPDTNSKTAPAVAIDYYFPSSIYVGGTHNSQGLSGNEESWFYVTRLNDDFEIEYEKYLGGDDYYVMYNVTASKDGGVLLSGMRARVGAPSYDRNAYLIKIDSTGCITNLPENSTIQLKDALVYPNPGSEKLMLRTALKNCTFNLFDVNGTCVLKEDISRHISTFETSSLKCGTYLYVISRQGQVVESDKWIKQ